MSRNHRPNQRASSRSHRPSGPQRPAYGRSQGPQQGRPQGGGRSRFHKSTPGHSSLTPSPSAMETLLKRSEITLSPEALERLWMYHNLIRHHNQDRDLTRIVGFEPMVIKHYADCLWIAKLVELPKVLLDIGTGAGFPGIPIKIAQPELEITLAEPRPRRVTFLRMAVEKLGLKNCQVFEHRVVSQSFQTPVEGVITRALETMDKTFLRTSGCTQPGTKLIFMKGPNADEEIQDVKKRFGKYLNLIQDKKFTLPHTTNHRRVVVWERTDVPFQI